MLATLNRWGNSQAIRIPQKILNSMELSEKDTLEIKVEDGVLIAKKVITAKPKNLYELYESYYGKKLEEILRDGLIETEKEVDWGEPVGEEVW